MLESQHIVIYDSKSVLELGSKWFTYSNLYILLLREDFWKFLNESSQKFLWGQSYYLQREQWENSGCDLVWRTPQFIFFTFCMWGTHILAVLCNWYLFSWILAKDPSVVNARRMSLIALTSVWPYISQTGLFTTLGLSLLAPLHILERANLPPRPYGLSMRPPQRVLSTRAHPHV